jgi:hypothetical protein
MKPTRTILTIGAAVALAVGGGVAGAAIPNTNGAINACYISGQGGIRIIDTATTTCKSNETPITWNQTGNPGTNGADGAAGVSGYVTVVKDAILPEGAGSEGGAIKIDCPTGKHVISGGYASLITSRETTDPVEAGSSNLHIYQSVAYPDSTGWTIAYYMTAEGQFLGLRGRIICATTN